MTIDVSDDTDLDDLLAGAEEQLHTSPAAAEAVLDGVVDRAAALRRPRQEGQARYLRARILAERGELDRAVAEVAAARQLFHAADEPLRAARTDLGRMQILDDLGRHAEAVAIGEALLDELPSLPTRGPDDTRVKALITASAWGNCGVAHGYLGHHQRSLAAYERAEQGYAELGMEVERAQWQANRGVELLNLGSVREAQDAFSQAASGFETAGDLMWFAECQGDLAQTDHMLGNLVGALARLDRAQSILQELGADAELARVLLQRGQTYLDAGLWRESQVASDEAAVIAAAAGMRHDLAHAHFLAARAAAAGGALSTAEQELASAAALFQEVGDAQFAARADVVAAELLLRRGGLDEGAAKMEVAVQALAAGGWKIPAGHGMLDLHDAAVLPADKEAWLAAAAEIAGEVGHPTLATAVRLRQAQARRAHGDADAAAQILRGAIAKIEDLGSALSEPLLATAFRSAKRPVYDELVHVLACRGTPEALREAVALSDRAKAQTLQDLVDATVGRGRQRGGPETEDERAVAAYRRDLSAVYAAIHESREPSRTSPLRERASELESRLGDLLVRSHTSDPRPQVDDGDQQVPTVADRPRRPGVVFHVAAADVIAFVVDGEDVSCTLLRGAYDRVVRLVAQLNAQWARFRMGHRIDMRQHEAHLVATTRSVLGELYDVLLRPLDLPIGDDSTVVVTPDRVLHRVPFHALHDGTSYLVERCAVVISPTTLAEPTAVRTPDLRLLVVGVPDERAPHIADEVARVAPADTSSATVLLGDAATAEAFGSATRDATHVHLACHGMYREENPLFSSLRFADRWSTLSEVLELDLAGKAITLSACESGRADDAAEPVGMAWGFLAAGARSVVVSQWVLDDESSAEVMASYHDHLRAGGSSERALRSAQLAVMAQRPHPYHWAPFVHVESPFAARTTSGTP